MLNHKDILNELKGQIAHEAPALCLPSKQNVLYRLGDTTWNRRRLEYYGAEPQGETFNGIIKA